ncbi:MAG TPA: hypothetical protein ENJ01_12015 [Gammaproteobacteria bacterium]|nr:hypothetical protein [Gammaproteobacteria bacterium]
MSTKQDEIPKIQRVIAILWPSFLTAGLATILFFTAFDPVDMMVNAGYGEINRLGGYTIGFFLFWITTSLSCALTCYFQRPCDNNSE